MVKNYPCLSYVAMNDLFYRAVSSQEGKRIDFTIDIESAVGLPKRFNVCFMSIFSIFEYRASLAFGALCL